MPDVDNVNGIAFSDIEEINGRTDANIEKINGLDFAAASMVHQKWMLVVL